MKKQININDGLVELSLDEKYAICGGESAGITIGRWLRRAYVALREHAADFGAMVAANPVLAFK